MEQKIQERICESCGMPMKQASDFGGMNPENKYCRFCTFENGELHDYQTRLDGMAGFLVSRMNIDKSAALEIAKENMSKMPAWKDHK